MTCSIVLHTVHYVLGAATLCNNPLTATIFYDSWIIQVIVCKLGISILGSYAWFGKVVWFSNFCWEHKLVVVTGKGRLNRVNVRLILWITSFFIVFVRFINCRR